MPSVDASRKRDLGDIIKIRCPVGHHRGVSKCLRQTLFPDRRGSPWHALPVRCARAAAIKTPASTNVSFTTLLATRRAERPLHSRSHSSPEEPCPTWRFLPKLAQAATERSS